MKACRPQWSLEDTHRLVSLAKEGWPVAVISLKVKRSESDVLAKLLELRLAPPLEL
jgi:hypothetical protein